MIQVEVDGRLYEIPEIWLVAAMQARRVLGMTPTEAAADAIYYWVTEHTPKVGFTHN